MLADRRRDNNTSCGVGQESTQRNTGQWNEERMKGVGVCVRVNAWALVSVPVDVVAGVTRCSWILLRDSIDAQYPWGLV